MYRTHVYGEICAAHVDPIEKKPLFHYFPTAKAYSVAAAGCNFICTFCQNWEISQSPLRSHGVQGRATLPVQVVENATAQACASIAYTYSEPTVFFEWAAACGRCVRSRGEVNGRMLSLVDLWAAGRWWLALSLLGAATLPLTLTQS